MPQLMLPEWYYRFSEVLTIDTDAVLNPDHDFYDDVVEAFTRGWCWALGEALHELKGWEPYVAWRYSWEAENEEEPEESSFDNWTAMGMWSHIFVSLPDNGALIDIRGRCDDLGSYPDGMGYGLAKPLRKMMGDPIDWDTLGHDCDEQGQLDMARECASMVAPVLIKRLEELEMIP